MKLLKKTKVFAIIFYVLAAIFCLYTIFSIVTTATYLSSVASSGMYMDVGFSDMLNAFMSTVGPNLFYTFMFFFCGYMIQLVAGDIIPEDQEFEEHIETPTEVSTNTITSVSEPLTETTETFPEPAIELEVREEPSEVEDVVATIADIENEAEFTATEESEELLLAETPDEPEMDKVEDLEEEIAEEIDLAEPENEELEQVETEDEED